MSKPNKVNKPNEPEVSEVSKAYDQAMIINNFATNFQFCKDLGFALIRGEQINEHMEVLQSSIKGLEEFINLLKEKISK